MHFADLLGSNTVQTAQILALLESIGEMKKAYGALVPYGTSAQ